jgi:predicted phosphodiesterase
LKLGLISDVHGDAEALRGAWTLLTELGVDRIVCAGDLVGYGPDPDQVVAFLVEHQIASVRGNHDRWALARPLGTPDEFGGGTPDAATREFLGGLPPYLLVDDGPRVGVIVHGSPRSDMEFVTPASHPPSVLRQELKTLDADLLVVGHTHTPMWYRCDLGLVVNPGSIISLPVVKSSRTFAVVDLQERAVAFHELKTGKPIALAPWDDG